MNQNSNAILTLCSHLCVGEDIVPLEPKEWSVLAQKLVAVKKTPADLFSFSRNDFMALLSLSPEETERVIRLIDRSASLSFEIERYQNMGIEAVTRADTTLYPQALRKKLENSCPPIFYYAGDLSLLKRNYIGYVGSRSVSSEDIEFTTRAVQRTVKRGYGVVSGGAKGIDTISGMEALSQDSFVIEYLSDSMLKKMKNRETIQKIQNGRLLMLSVTKPDAGFNVGTAMMRNKYIYAQSEATVIVRSELNKGGTWTGANENLKHNWCKPLCWNHDYPGNIALIEKGAISIPDNWDGMIPETTPKKGPAAAVEQLSLFV